MYTNATDIVRQWAALAPERKERFSPKPWKNCAPRIDGKVDEYFRSIESSQGYFDQQTKEGFCILTLISKPNADLITAAPELYHAGKTAKEQMYIGLSAIQKLIEYNPESEALKRMEAEMKQAIEQMSAALSKALGEQ